MHRLNVAHRDIKPANIFVTKALDVRLGDLGVCRIIVDPSQTYVGSPIYMSPEQHQNLPYGLAGDIWAVRTPRTHSAWPRSAATLTAPALADQRPALELSVRPLRERGAPLAPVGCATSLGFGPNSRCCRLCARV